MIDREEIAKEIALSPDDEVMGDIRKLIIEGAEKRGGVSPDWDVFKYTREWVD